MCSPSSWWQPLPLIASALGACRSLGLTVFCAWLHACGQCLGVANAAGDDLLNHLLSFTSIARPAVLELCLFAAACCARMLSELVKDVVVGTYSAVALCRARRPGYAVLCSQPMGSAYTISAYTIASRCRTIAAKTQCNRIGPQHEPLAMVWRINVVLHSVLVLLRRKLTMAAAACLSMPMSQT